MPSGRVLGSKNKKPQIISPARIEAWRASVRANEIQKRIQDQALGILTAKVKDEKGRSKVVPYQMSFSELKAAEMLLSRCIPTVSAVEITGAGGGPVESRVVLYMPQNGRGK